MLPVRYLKYPHSIAIPWTTHQWLNIIQLGWTNEIFSIHSSLFWFTWISRFAKWMGFRYIFGSQGYICTYNYTYKICSRFRTSKLHFIIYVCPALVYYVYIRLANYSCRNSRFIPLRGYFFFVGRKQYQVFVSCITRCRCWLVARANACSEVLMCSNAI